MCTVKVANIPVAQIPNFKVISQGQTYKLPQDGKISIPLDKESSSASIKTNDQFKGYVSLNRANCRAGTVTLPAKLKDARVRFTGLPDGAAVQCKSGCPEGYNGAPKLPATPWKFPMKDRLKKVTFYFQAKGYVPRTLEKGLSPGSNTFKVTLKRREN